MRLCCLLAASIALIAAPLRAADDPLDALPSEIGIVLRLSPPTTIATKSRAFLNNAAPQYTPLADSVNFGLGSLVGNPTLTGIDASRDWYVAVLPRSDKRPAVIFALPTSDPATFKQGVGKGFTFSEHDDWIVYSLDAEAMKSIPSDASKSIRGAIVEPMKTVFVAGEAGLFLNVPVLREIYRPQIERAKEQVATLGAQRPAGDTAPQANEANLKTVESLLATIDDLTGIAKSVTINATALEAEAVIAVEPDSNASKFLAKKTPGKFPLLAKLPQGQPVYYAMAGDFSDLIGASIGSLEAAGGNEALRDEIEKLREIRFEEIAGSMDVGNLESGVYRVINLVKVDQPEEYLRLAREISKKMDRIESNGLTQEVTLTPDGETIGDVKVDVLRMKIVPNEESDNPPSSRVFEILFGKDGMTQRMAVVDDLFVQAVGDSEVMNSALESISGDSARDEPAAKAADATRSHLSESANILALVDLPRVAAAAVSIAIEAQQLPLPVDRDRIASLELPPSYTGLTSAADKDELRIRGHMPAEQVKGIVDLFSELQKAAPQRRRTR